MKRIAAVAVWVALFALPVCAQRGGGHGGFSGSRGSFSGSRGGGFSGFHGAPSFHGGFTGPSRGGFSGFRGYAPGRIAGSPRYRGYPGPYFGRNPIGPRWATNSRGFAPTSGLRSPGLRQPSTGFRPAYTGAMRRAPYRSSNAWNRGSSDHRGRDRDHDRRNFYALYGAGYPFLPWWDLGYPYYPGYFDDFGDDDSQSDSYSADSQPYPDNSPGPYQQPPPDQQQPSPYAPWPYSYPGTSNSPSQPAPSSHQASAPAEQAQLTVIFKDGRPPEKIHNYMLTASTLYVLDQQHQDIPVNQIDLTATTQVNREAGIEFALPGGPS